MLHKDSSKKVYLLVYKIHCSNVQPSHSRQSIKSIFHTRNKSWIIRGDFDVFLTLELQVNMAISLETSTPALGARLSKVTPGTLHKVPIAPGKLQEMCKEEWTLYSGFYIARISLKSSLLCTSVKKTSDIGFRYKLSIIPLNMVLPILATSWVLEHCRWHPPWHL